MTSSFDVFGDFQKPSGKINQNFVTRHCGLYKLCGVCAFAQVVKSVCIKFTYIQILSIYLFIFFCQGVQGCQFFRFQESTKIFCSQTDFCPAVAIKLPKVAALWNPIKYRNNVRCKPILCGDNSIPRVTLGSEMMSPPSANKSSNKANQDIQYWIVNVQMIGIMYSILLGWTVREYWNKIKQFMASLWRPRQSTPGQHRQRI